MKEYLLAFWSALIGASWRVNAFYFYKGKGMNNQFAYKEMTKLSKEQFRKIESEFV